MVRRGRGRGRGRSGRIAALSRRITSLNRREDGITLRGGPDPTLVTSAPWNSFVCVFHPTSDSGFTFGDLQKRLCVQLGLRTGGPANFVNVKLLFKLHRFKVWELKGHAISVQAQDLHYAVTGLTTAAEPVNLFDYPGRNRWAHIGYEFPKAQQNIVIDPTVAAKSTFLTVSTPQSVTTNDSTVIYVYGLWKSYLANDIPPGFNHDFQNLTLEETTEADTPSTSG